MNQDYLKLYKYNGARSMVLLHERYLSNLLNTWREAKKHNIKLPTTDDKDYESLDTLLKHILGAARRYMVWMCEKLDLPDPGIEPEPDATDVENDAENYLRHVFEKWRSPLADVEYDEFVSKTYTSRWGVEYCIDAMLEHAVMHPIRHEFQLRNLIENQKPK